MAKFCPECGFKLEDNAKFCENCGAPCPADEAAPAIPAQPAPQPVIPPAVPVQPAPQPAPRPMPPSAPRPQTQQYGDSYQQSYTPSAGVYGANAPVPVKKSKTGLIVALSVIAVLLIAAAIVAFVVWKPFDKKDDKASGGSNAPASQNATLPTQTPATDAPAVKPTQAPTEAPTQAPTEAPTQPATAETPASYRITDADRAEIQQKLSAILEYGYSSTNADLAHYLSLTFEYNFCLDSDEKKSMFTDNLDTFYEDSENYKATYGSNYTITATVTDVDVYEGDDFDDELSYYSDEYDVSGVEAIVTVNGTASFSGDLDSDDLDVEWEFIKVNGKWYPVY